MEKQQAIDLFDNFIGMIEDNQDNDYNTVFRMVIEALKAQLSQEGTTSDLISRTETVEHLRRVLDATVPITDYDEGFVDGVEFGINTASTMPTIQPEPRTGKWALGFDNRYMEKYYYCSRCGGRKYGEHEPLDYFCSNCGADMRGEKDG